MRKHLARRLSTLLTAFVLLLGLMLPASAAHTVVRTIGDDLSALESTNSCYFNNPVAMAKDADGNIYVADMGNHRIVKLDNAGNIIGKFGSLGTGNSQFDTPFGVAIDNDGNILVADTANHRIQKFDSQWNYLTQWGSEGSGNGQFGLAREIGIDSQNHYHVCDEFHDRIQVFDEDGTYLYQYGGKGSGQGQFSLPQGIAVRQSPDGDRVYICDTFNHRVQVLDVQGNYITQIGGTSGDSSTSFTYPRGVNIDTNGDVYIADTFNHKIKVYNASHIFQFETSLNLVDLEPCYPCQVLPLGDGRFILSDTGNSQLLLRNQSTVLRHVGTQRTTDYAFSNVSGIATDSNGNYYVSDSLNHRVLKYNSNGTLVYKLGGNSGNGGPGAYGINYWQFTSPKQVSYDRAFSRLLIADTGNSRIQVFKANGTWISNFGYGVFSNPMGVCTDSYGNIYIADTGNNRIMKCNAYGITIKTWGGFGTTNGKFNMPTYITCDSNNNVYVVDRNNCRIQKFSSNGVFLGKWGTNGGNASSNPLDNWGTEDGELFLPVGIACDSNDRIYVTDSSNNRVQVFTSSGTFVESFGHFSGSTDGFFSPQGIACSGNKVYVTDALLNRVSVFEH